MQWCAGYFTCTCPGILRVPSTTRHIIWCFLSFSSRIKLEILCNRLQILNAYKICAISFKTVSIGSTIFGRAITYQNMIEMAFEELYRQESKIDCLLFDLDDTLYPLSTGLANGVLKNIGDYMVEKLGIDRGKIAGLCDQLYKNYGTTMAGLRIFTNADKIHAAKALSRLGLEDCFEGIICFETLNSPIEGEPVHESNIFDIIGYSTSPNPSIELPKAPIICKPSEYAIDHALKIANIDPQRTIFFDDSVRNIQAGKRVGLQTVLVGKSQRVKGADYALESIHNIREALPELWEEAEKSEDIRYSGKVAIETSVTA
ncbi:uncharacterized protein A4U43_C08F35400 [Asparagus officinalis]|nr:uncharacterized protein A4U43_C08F35400 [Asparagus officinalis]